MEHCVKVSAQPSLSGAGGAEKQRRGITAEYLKINL